jgi:hypothetical protein
MYNLYSSYELRPISPIAAEIDKKGKGLVTIPTQKMDL